MPSEVSANGCVGGYTSEIKIEYEIHWQLSFAKSLVDFTESQNT